MLTDSSSAPLAVADDADSSIDALDRAIVNLAARLNAVTHDFLILVRRFDERAGWLGWGFESCADWLHWRCDLSLSAAREKVRVAHALKTLPAIAMAFARGELSYSKVRALTRVAGRENEDALLDFALRTTAARVEERCRELRCGTVASTDEALRAHARRSLSLRRDPERGTITITVELPLETAELVDKALDRAVEATASSTSELAEESWAAQRADALVALATTYLGGSGEAAGGTSDHYQVVVHVDESALRGSAGRAGLPIESLRRIGCDSDRVVLVEDEHGEPLSVGRKSRVVPQAIKRALWARDRGCRFPGCGRRRFVDAHHIVHWSVGGETSLPNLMLLCSKHHTLIHEGGFRIEKDYRDRWFFRRPDGRAVPACGYRAEDMRDDDSATEDDYFAAHPSAEGRRSTRLSAERSRVAEPSAEVYRASRPSADVLPFRFRRAFRACGEPISFTPDPLRDVVRTLAGPELDDAKVREAVLMERVLADDGFDCLPALADRQDDPALSRYFPAGHEEIACTLVLLQEPDVRAHLRVDLAQVGLVDELDDEHGDNSSVCMPQT